MIDVQTLLRRLARLKRLREMHAPSALLAAEGALIDRSISRLSANELLQVAETFVDYWASV